VVICLERGADLHMAKLMPLPLTLSCFSKIQITGFTFLVLAHPDSPRKGPLSVCVCVCVYLRLEDRFCGGFGVGSAGTLSPSSTDRQATAESDIELKL